MLFRSRLDGQSLAVFADAAKEPLKVRKKGNAFEVACEEHQATAGGEAVRSGVNTRDSMPGRRAIVGADPDIGHNPLGVAWDLFVRTLKIPTICNLAQRVFCIRTSESLSLGPSKAILPAS